MNEVTRRVINWLLDVKGEQSLVEELQLPMMCVVLSVDISAGQMGHQVLLLSLRTLTVRLLIGTSFSE